ncbi:hypothetical protein ES703_28025 [subsurface metagenome]
MKANFWFFVGLGIVLLLISLSGQILGQVMENYPEKFPPFLSLALLLMTFVIEIILGIGLIKIVLGFCDSLKPRFSTLFNGWDCFWRYLGAGLLYCLIVGGAFIACILPFTLLSVLMRTPWFALVAFIAASIPIAILSIKFSLCFYFVIDRGLGPINALRASSWATKGAKWSLFVFGILCGLINFLGFLCLFVGLFATFPTIMVAMALVYRDLSAQTPELAKLGVSSLYIDLDTSKGDAAGIQPVTGIQSEPGIQLDPAIQSGLGIRRGQGVQLSEGIQPAAGIQPKVEKKSSNSLLLWVVVLGVGVVIAAGIGYYYFRPRVKDAVALHRAMVSQKNLAVTGILYSEDNPSAIIGGAIVREGDMIDDVKVVKIRKNIVEFEKNGEKWTQEMQ